MIDLVKEIARKAGNILLHTKRTITQEKGGGGNWVTEADVASEQYIKKEIQKHFPDHFILSEETQSKPHDWQDVSHLWVVDPLDGTTNFAHGLPFFCISIAYVEKGEVIRGAIYDPNHDEVFWAEKGTGAFLNKAPIHVDESSNFSGALIDIGCPYHLENFEKVYPLGPLFHAQGSRLVNYGSGALECAYVACGRLALYIERGLKSWDIAAAKLILEEAGGVMEGITQPFSLFDPQEVIVGSRELVKKSQAFISQFYKSQSL